MRKMTAMKTQCRKNQRNCHKKNYFRLLKMTARTFALEPPLLTKDSDHVTNFEVMLKI